MMTPAQRQLRQNIRNCYMVATLEELKKELAYRTRKGANSFELECFNQLIRESLAESNCAGSQCCGCPVCA